MNTTLNPKAVKAALTAAGCDPDHPEHAPLMLAALEAYINTVSQAWAEGERHLGPSIMTETWSPGTVREIAPPVLLSGNNQVRVMGALVEYIDDDKSCETGFDHIYIRGNYDQLDVRIRWKNGATWRVFPPYIEGPLP